MTPPTTPPPFDCSDATDQITPPPFVVGREPPPSSSRGTYIGCGVQKQTERTVPAQFGPLAPLLTDPVVTDVFVNGDGSVWIDRGGGAVVHPPLRLDRRLTRSLAVTLVALAGRHVDEATPCTDVRLADGIRVHAVLPPVCPAGPLLSIRLPRPTAPDLDDLERSGSFEFVSRARLETAVRERANILVTGAAGSGKTTLLAGLLAGASPSERIVTLEDVAELRIPHPHVVSLETRQPNLEGAGGIDLARLVREALRMRPDRLVVGECRGAEIRELLSALNTGHDGGAGTLHANSLDSVPARLEAVGALAGMPPDTLARQVESAFDLVVHLERRGGRRVVAGLGAFVLDEQGRLGMHGVTEP